jgi:hypothetical protein
VLKHLAKEAHQHDVDLALILASDAAYSVAQRTRNRDDFAEASLSSHQFDLLDRLAEYAKAGHLVLFAGAGLSKSAGLPLWPELIEALTTEAGLTADESVALKALPPIDGASILEKRLAAKGIDLRTMAMKATTSPCFGIGHALLASLPVLERVTTNYDDLIEQSLDVIGRSAAVLPYEPSTVSNGWLLKLHGSTSNTLKTASNDIVLTRQDYLRYDGRRGALYGIVQALLLTRHILFVGFSLEDDNFYALADEVRRAVEGTNGTSQVRSQFGTALVPSGKLLMKDLWEREVDIEVIGDFPHYPRALEIALDYLGCKATTNLSHLFDATFSEILNQEEIRLRDAVRDMRLQLGDISASTFETTRAFFRKLGVP